MYSQMFSTGFDSGAYGGKGSSTMLSGRFSRAEVCHPALSRTSTAMAPTETQRLMATRCSFIASIPTVGMVFIHHHIEAPVQSVLNAPVGANDRIEALG